MIDDGALRHDDGDPRGEEIAEEFWPYDGPHSARKTETAATLVARLVRYMNNATQTSAGLEYVPAAGRVLNNVTSAVYGLDQLLDQLARFVMRAEHDPRLAGALYDDRYDRPSSQTVDELALHLHDTRAAVQRLANQLDAAASIASHLGHETRAGD